VVCMFVWCVCVVCVCGVCGVCVCVCGVCVCVRLVCLNNVLKTTDGDVKLMEANSNRNINC